MVPNTLYGLYRIRFSGLYRTCFSGHYRALFSGLSVGFLGQWTGYLSLWFVHFRFVFPFGPFRFPFRVGVLPVVSWSHCLSWDILGHVVHLGDRDCNVEI